MRFQLKSVLRLSAIGVVTILLVGGGLATITGEVGRSFGVAFLILGAAFGVVGAIYATGVFPTLLPQLVAALVARGQRLDVIGIQVGGTYLYRDTPGGPWRRSKLAGDVATLGLAAFDDQNLARRLRRVWIATMLTLAALVLGMIPLGLALDTWTRGAGFHDLAMLLAFLFLASSVYALVNALREDVRSPRSIAIALKAGQPLGDREMAYTMINGYAMRRTRPRDHSERWMNVVTDWLLEEPTAHEYRYLLFRYLLDRGDAEALQEQRRTMLALRGHLGQEAARPAVQLVIWYAAYLSPTATEAEKLWSLVPEVDPDLEIGQVWLRARIAALKGRPALARRLARRAKAEYRDSAPDGATFAFEQDQLDGLLAGLPRRGGRKARRDRRRLRGLRLPSRRGKG